MQLSAPDFRFRAQLTELMDEPCSRDVLRACLRDIARTNRWTFAYRPLLHWLDAITAPLPALDGPLRILDVGCGYGDGLRRIERWAELRRIPVELTGLDLNPDATAVAAEASSAACGIQWVTADILTYTPARAPHLVVSSLFTHHLGEDQIVQFIRWMEDHARLGWFINDLSRAPIPEHSQSWPGCITSCNTMALFPLPAPLSPQIGSRCALPPAWASRRSRFRPSHRPGSACRGERRDDGRASGNRSTCHWRRACGLHGWIAPCFCRARGDAA